MPKADPKPAMKETISTLVTLFESQPFRDPVSSFKSKKSYTLGFLSHASTKPTTIPAPIVGFNEVRGAARKPAITDKGCPCLPTQIKPITHH